MSPPLSPLPPPCHLMLSSPPRLQVPGEHLHPLRAGRGGPEGPSCRGVGVKGMGDTSSASVPPPLQVVRGLSAGARVFEFMTLEPQVPLRGGDTIPSHSLLGHVAFRHVSFRSAPPQRSPCATDVPRSPSLTSPPAVTPRAPGTPCCRTSASRCPPVRPWPSWDPREEVTVRVWDPHCRHGAPTPQHRQWGRWGRGATGGRWPWWARGGVQPWGAPVPNGAVVMWHQCHMVMSQQ